MMRNLRKMVKVVVGVLLIAAMSVLSVNDVKAEGCDYSHSVTCDCGEVIWVTEHLYVAAPSNVQSSVTVASGTLNRSNHTLFVVGRVGEYYYKTLKWVGEQGYNDIPAGTHEYDWSGYDYYAQSAKVRFYIKKGTGEHSVESLQQGIGY